MYNRTGTYIGFDGLGQTNPSYSDYKYYSMILGWNASKTIDFRVTNSHEKASAVRDTSQRATLEASIRVRLSASKNCLIILSDATRKSGSFLSYEIEQAVDRYQLPLIIAYVGYDTIFAPKDLAYRWPSSLADRLNGGHANAIHIPFKKEPILDAIGQFTVNTKSIGQPFEYYSLEAHKHFGCL